VFVVVVSPACTSKCLEAVYWFFSQLAASTAPEFLPSSQHTFPSSRHSPFSTPHQLSPPLPIALNTAPMHVLFRKQFIAIDLMRLLFKLHFDHIPRPRLFLRAPKRLHTAEMLLFRVEIPRVRAWNIVPGGDREKQG
jgi:hypothetical protein